jgi:hypothetical protein
MDRRASSFGTFVKNANVFGPPINVDLTVRRTCAETPCILPDPGQCAGSASIHYQARTANGRRMLGSRSAANGADPVGLLQATHLWISSTTGRRAAGIPIPVLAYDIISSTSLCITTSIGQTAVVRNRRLPFGTLNRSVRCAMVLGLIELLSPPRRLVASLLSLLLLGKLRATDVAAPPRRRQVRCFFCTRRSGSSCSPVAAFPVVDPPKRCACRRHSAWCRMFPLARTEAGVPRQACGGSRTTIASSSCWRRRSRCGMSSSKRHTPPETAPYPSGDSRVAKQHVVSPRCVSAVCEGSGKGGETRSRSINIIVGSRDLSSRAVRTRDLERPAW